MVEYKQFCEEIETAFGEKHLEKDPLVVSSQFEVKAHVFNRDLTQVEQDDARSALAKIAERVKQKPPNSALLVSSFFSFSFLPKVNFVEMKKSKK